MTEEPIAESTTSAPDSAAIRSEIEQVRADYHELLGSLSADDWKKKSANAAWSVGQLMWHLGRGVEFFPQAVAFCRKGKAPNPPMWIVNPVNVLITRWGSRGATPQSVAAKYDEANTALLTCLDTIQADDWGKSVTAYGTHFTIESTFRSAREHFSEHEADILKGLGRL